MNEKKEEVKRCTDCKHFRYEESAAHKNRCAKFKEDGKHGIIAAIRVEGGKCHNGKGHEK